MPVAHSPERIEQVRRVLTQPQRSSVDLGAELGLSSTWVRKVRRGLLFARLFPELPREKSGRRMSSEQAEDFVRETLTSGLSEQEVAAKWNVHPATVQRVATGGMYAGVLPELPRRGLRYNRKAKRVLPRRRDVTCYDCRLFGDGKCSLELPDAHSFKAASRCAAFWDKNEVACYDAVAA